MVYNICLCLLNNNRHFSGEVRVPGLENGGWEGGGAPTFQPSNPPSQPPPPGQPGDPPPPAPQTDQMNKKPTRQR